MELRHIRYFLTLAEELHFGKAAQKLYISQPPLSRQIRELENELGVQLFSRENKRVTLTLAGEHFKKESLAIIKHLELAKFQTNQIHHSLAGEIRIGYISSINKKILGFLIKKLNIQYPFLQTKLFELSSNQQLQALIDQKMDIGLIRAPISSPLIHTEKLYDDGFSLVYPKGFTLPKDLSKLSSESFISFHADYAPVYHNHMLAYCAELGFSPLMRHQCNNMSSIIEFVQLDLGISVVPKSLIQQYEHLSLNFLSLKESTLKTDIILAHARENKHPALEQIRTLIRELFTP